MISRRQLILAFGVAPIVWSRAVRAQQAGKVYRLAILTQAEPIDQSTGKRDRAWTAFFDELRRLGNEEGRNLVVMVHSSEGDAQRAGEVARQIVELQPDVIFSPDVRMAGHLKVATPTIPVVAITLDPVGTGLAISLARPGSNVTGFTIDAGLEIFGKRFEILKQAVPTASRTGWLVPRRVIDFPFSHAIRVAARSAGITLVDAVLEAPVDVAAYRRAFDAMARDGVDALWVGASLENLAHRRLIAELAVEAKLPGMFAYRENVEAGGLMSFGNDAADTFRRSAAYVDRILKGANPADLPFQQPTQFELVINLKTAKALGLEFPPALLAQADEVIE
jgi:putative ABC transport system substrate-binding protein